MDTSVYSNYALVRATVQFARRIRANNPELWKRIKAEAAQREADDLAALQDSQADYTDGDMQQLCEGVV